MRLSIVIPVFNEEKTILAVLKRIEELELPHIEKEVIIVDDFSKDSSSKKIQNFLGKGKKGFIFLKHTSNQGKGAAVRTGIKNATGSHIIIQDADLEYNPKDIIRIVQALQEGKEVVYGSRLNRMPHFSKEERRPQFLLHYFGNKLLSLMTSVLFGQWVTDMETCYKLFPKEIANSMNLTARGFEFEPEITAKLMKKGLKIYEIPITTKPRGYDEGKKLNTVKDGTKAVWTLMKYRFVN